MGLLQISPGFHSQRLLSTVWMGTTMTVLMIVNSSCTLPTYRLISTIWSQFLLKFPTSATWRDSGGSRTIWLVNTHVTRMRQSGSRPFTTTRTKGRARWDRRSIVLKPNGQVLWLTLTTVRRVTPSRPWRLRMRKNGWQSSHTWAWPSTATLTASAEDTKSSSFNGTKIVKVRWLLTFEGSPVHWVP